MECGIARVPIRAGTACRLAKSRDDSRTAAKPVFPLIYLELLEKVESLHLDRVYYFSRLRKFFRLGAFQGRSEPYCKFGTPLYVGNYKARKLKFCMHLDRVE